MRNLVLLIVVIGVGAIAGELHAQGDPNATFTVRTLGFPDHGKGNITMDYITYDPKTGYVLGSGYKGWLGRCRRHKHRQGP